MARLLSVHAPVAPAFAAVPMSVPVRRLAHRSAERVSHGASMQSACMAVPVAAALAVGTLRGVGKGRAGRRLGARARDSRRFARCRSVERQAASDQPLFVTVSSTASTWQSAVAELFKDLQELNQCGGSWDFGVAFISGYDNQDDAVLGVTTRLDGYLGTKGSFVGMAAQGNVGIDGEGERKVHVQKPGQSSITVTAVQLPRNAEDTLGEDVQEARPFICGKEELMQISQIALRLQDSMIDSNGVRKNSTPKAWRDWLGQDKSEPKGILLFADPCTSQYVEKNVLGGLDLAFPSACKVGGVSTHLRPTGRLAASPGPGLPPVEVEGKMAGIVLPSSIAIHALVNRSAFVIGKKLEITKAQGHIITEINGESPQKALRSVRRQAAPLEEVLIGRSGFLLGVEAPMEEETAHSGNRPPPIVDDTLESQWLMRSFEVMPDGNLYVYNHDFKSVPQKVGKQTKTIQLHVQDDYRTRDSGRLMLDRYGGARMMMENAPSCFGALRFQCAGTGAGSDAEEREEQLKAMLGMDDLLVAGAVLRGEFGPAGMALGGYDSQRTARHAHVVTTCLLCYSPEAKGAMSRAPLAELQTRR